MQPDPLKTEIRDVLMRAESSSVALKDIFHLKKTRSRHISYAFLAQKLEQKSRGYVADLVNGKRRVPQKLVPPLVSALGLEPAAQEYFMSLVAYEHAKEGEERAHWQSELLKLKKLFQMHETTDAEITFGNLFFTFELFCAMSLYQGRCTRELLAQHFGPANKEALSVSLKQLLDMGAVAEENGLLVQKMKHLNLAGTNRFVYAVNFLLSSLTETQRVLTKWFQRPKESLFDSTIISVKRSEYEQKLPTLINEMQKLKTELENDEADQLIRFNVQIFPLRHD